MKNLTLTIFLLVICHSATAEEYCAKPNLSNTLSFVSKCLDKSKSLDESKLCASYYKDYLTEFEKWKPCALHNLLSDNSEKVEKFIKENEEQEKKIVELMYCMSFGKIWEPNTICAP